METNWRQCLKRAWQLLPVTPSHGRAAFFTDGTARTKLVPTSLGTQVPPYNPVWDREDQN